MRVTSVTKSHDGSLAYHFNKFALTFRTDALAAEAAELFSLRNEIAMSFNSAPAKSTAARLAQPYKRATLAQRMPRCGANEFKDGSSQLGQ